MGDSLSATVTAPDDYSPRDEQFILVRQRVALVLVLVLGAFHAWATWGYAGPFWGDHGRWLHQVARASLGEVAYRDFAWTEPPLAVWLLGHGARMAGTSLAAVSALTFGIYVALLLAFYLLARRLTREVILPVTLTALLFAAAYACRDGVPLPLGTITPSLPVGMLFLLLAVIALLRLEERRDLLAAASTGVFAALAALATHHLWPGVAAVLGIAALLLRRGDHVRQLTTLMLSFAAVVAVGVVAVGAQAGGRAVANVLTGSGELGASIAWAIPTLERLVLEAAAVAAMTLVAVTALWLCLAITDAAAARWAGGALIVFLAAAAADLGMIVGTATRLADTGLGPWPTSIEYTLWRVLSAARPLTTSALGILDDRFQTHIFPAAMPAVLLVVLLVRWRRWTDIALRNRLTMLLAICAAVRLPDGLAGSSWFNVLLEAPVYVLVFRLVSSGAVRQSGRAVLSALGIYLLFGVYNYVGFGRGPLTFRSGYAATATAEGPVRWSPADADLFKLADSLIRAADPSGQRPLLAFGQTGGWNYYLGRKNPTPVERGWYVLTPRAADAVQNEVRALDTPFLLVDNDLAPRSAPLRTLSLVRWDAEMGPSPFEHVDRARFGALAAECPAAATGSSRGATMRVLACPAQATR